jgi:hypothetical protein
MELDLRGTPAWQIRGYLIGLGGQEAPDGSLAGPGWTATLTELEHVAFRIVMPRIIVRFAGDPTAVKEVHDRLRLRAIRAGG